MKNSRIIIAGWLLAVGLLYGSCIDEVVEQVIPQIDSQVTTRNSGVSWEDCEECCLPSGEKVYLPWNVRAKSCIPNDIRTDIKSSDGWVILDTTVDLIGYDANISGADNGCNYLLMYNKETGFLKGFYYMEQYMQNNYGFWNLYTTTPTKLFNFTQEFAIPLSEEGPQMVTVSNLTRTVQTQGFDVGWNCFMLELSYDSNSSKQKLDITGFAMNATEVILEGKYIHEGSGVIESTSSKGTSPVKGIFKSVGEVALTWLSDSIASWATRENAYAEMKTSTVQTNSNNRALSGIASLVVSGLQKVASSLTGKSSSSSCFSFSAHTEATITGNLVNTSSGIIAPITGLNLGNENMELGIWNLAKQPLHKLSSVAILRELRNDNFFYDMVTEPEYELVINPMISQPYTIAIYPVYMNEVSLYYDELLNGKYPWLKFELDENRPKPLPEGVLFGDSYTWSFVFALNYQYGWPNYTANNEESSVALGLDYGSVRGTIKAVEPIVYKVMYAHHSNGTYSSKTFIPKQVYDGSIIGGHPTTWQSLQDLRDKGVCIRSLKQEDIINEKR